MMAAVTAAHLFMRDIIVPLASRGLTYMERHGTPFSQLSLSYAFV
jgi:hypothetical protein